MMYYPDNLPVLNHKKEIIESLVTNQVTIIAGDTGSGKTTQLPKFCLEVLGENSKGIIGCTQPRRVAAVTVSERVAEELGGLGNQVGYQIRFHDRTTPETRIKFMTDGVLLAESQRDPLFSKYDVVILDEAHERSLNIDFLLGYFKNILVKRKDLKLIITSATIDTESFARHFPGSVIIAIEGRTFPVDIEYKPIEDDPNSDREGYLEHCVKAIEEIFMVEAPGDILAFLPTERDIRICCDLLKGRNLDAEVLPMFGRLVPADQRKIFKHYNKTKIVVATNVAETSITVPGIRYVVDSGLARISSYNVRAKTTSLPVSKISQASCDQRKGRCGRVAAGLCVRLYSEEDYLGRPQYTLPEIQRSNLAEVILRMIAFKLGDPRNFPFIDSPHSTTIRDGYKQLHELGAVTSKNTLTKQGAMMAKMPIDPCIARIIIESVSNNCLKEIKIIATALAIQDPRVRPADREKEADAAHAVFSHPHSDFIVLLNIWKHFHGEQGKVRSWSRLKKFCKTHFLSFQRMREWHDLHDQMNRVLKRWDTFQETNHDGSYEEIHRSLAIGFLRNIGRKKEKKIYQTTSNKEVMIFPGSHQFLKSGQWILAASFLETNRLYALTVATIEPEWLESIAGKLCKYSWDNPRWMKSRGQVVAEEKVSLFGLIFIAKRLVNFGQRDSRNHAEAREIFIQEALIGGQLQGSYPFLSHNLQLVKKWEDTQQRLRKRDILADDLILHNFYNKHLDISIYDRTTLNRSLKKKKSPKKLFLQENDILLRQVGDRELLDFPINRTIGSYQFKLEYNFEPGKTDDGVTMKIPVSLVDVVSPEICEWLVPGLLKEKITFLLKSLPKRIRKHLIPLNITVDRILDDIDQNKGSFYNALEGSILKFFTLTVNRADWSTELPPHLRMRFALYDDKGTITHVGFELHKLSAKLQEKPTQRSGQAALSSEDKKTIKEWDKKILKKWDFATLPEKFTLHTPRGEFAGFRHTVILPIPNKGGVEIGFLDSLHDAIRVNKQGMLCLYRLQFADQFKALKKYCTTTLSGPSSLVFIQRYKNKKEACDALVTFVLHGVFPGCVGNIHNQKTFEANLKQVNAAGLYRAGIIICDKVMVLLRRRAEVQKQIAHYTHLSKKTHSFSEKRFNQYQLLLDEIISSNFLLEGSVEIIDDYDRYLRGLFIRIERAYVDFSKDDKKNAQIIPHEQNLQYMVKNRKELSAEGDLLFVEYKNMLQEFRLSLFSPEIKTKKSVSAKKLKKLWNEISVS